MSWFEGAQVRIFIDRNPFSVGSGQENEYSLVVQLSAVTPTGAIGRVLSGHPGHLVGAKLFVRPADVVADP